ncbi:hypothetical protein GCM10023197_25720 [Gordonia humi]|uniref:Uncharacterized protein n=1 Tax=Gordonia humi TaxID=686429 RepID=A0A840EWD0_9ACTN|nr:hypothetical protein [Gordonia humi]
MPTVNRTRTGRYRIYSDDHRHYITINRYEARDIAEQLLNLINEQET